VLKVITSENKWVGTYKYKSFESPCPTCGIRGAHYCPPQNGCLFDGLDKDKVYGLACNCPKCSIGGTIDVWV